jgi:hypothetical protein
MNGCSRRAHGSRPPRPHTDATALARSDYLRLVVDQRFDGRGNVIVPNTEAFPKEDGGSAQCPAPPFHHFDHVFTGMDRVAENSSYYANHRI